MKQDSYSPPLSPTASTASNATPLSNTTTSPPSAEAQNNNAPLLFRQYTRHPAFIAEERAMLRGTLEAWEPSQNLAQWYPITLSIGNDHSHQIAWRYLGKRRFSAPFFSDTLNETEQASKESPPFHTTTMNASAEAMSSTQPHSPLNLGCNAGQHKRVCYTPLDILPSLSQALPCLATTGFIFHVSRCGSTLLTQLLAALPECVVLSEPPILDAFFRQLPEENHSKLSPSQSAVLQGLVAALCQQRFTEERYAFIKLDSWHLPFLPLIQQAFPKVPCLFLYRSPEAVLHSHHRHRGPQMIPDWMDATPLALRSLEAATEQQPQINPLERYTVQVLESFFRWGLQHTQAKRCYALHYNELPTCILPTLFPLFGIKIDNHQQKHRIETQLHHRSQFHAKQGNERFQGDPMPPTLDAIRLLNEWVTPLYAELEACRNNKTNK